MDGIRNWINGIPSVIVLRKYDAKKMPIIPPSSRRGVMIWWNCSQRFIFYGESGNDFSIICFWIFSLFSTIGNIIPLSYELVHSSLNFPHDIHPIWMNIYIFIFSCQESRRANYSIIFWKSCENPSSDRSYASLCDSKWSLWVDNTPSHGCYGRRNSVDLWYART